MYVIFVNARTTPIDTLPPACSWAFTWTNGLHIHQCLGQHLSHGKEISHLNDLASRQVGFLSVGMAASCPSWKCDISYVYRDTSRFMCPELDSFSKPVSRTVSLDRGLFNPVVTVSEFIHIFTELFSDTLNAIYRLTLNVGKKDYTNLLKIRNITKYFKIGLT